ncbi:MAG: helix-turn-helix transcriptional regulator [Candidatus Aureabacteria bacterium]|nr:helix-turn-helix transcriptional regulator [Candidatus Auribacterota bacterium]
MSKRPDPPLAHFGRRVRDLRFHKGWSQEELAARAHRHWSYVGQVERGERNVTLVTIYEFADALGVEPAALLARDLPDGVAEAPVGTKVRTGGRRGPRRASGRRRADD